MVYWSRSRQELWRKGDTSGDHQTVREAYYDCDGDTLLFKVDPARPRRLPHRRPHVLLPPFGTPRLMRCDPPEPGGVPRARRPVTRSCRCGPSCSPTSRRRWRRSRSWSATARGSCSSRSSTASGGAGSPSSGATRWRPSRCATASSRSTATPTCEVPTDRGMLAALEVLLDTYRGPELDELPPLTGGMMGYLGYDVIREVEHLPDVPPDDLGVPDAVMSMIGSLAAFDHWRQRVTLIESVPTHGARRRRARRRLRRRRRSGSPPRSPTSAARCRTRRSSRRDRDDPLPDVRSSSMAGGDVPAGGQVGQGAHRGRRHLPGGARPALRPRPARPTRSTSTGCCARSTRARTCTSCARRSSRSSARRPSRWCSCGRAR